MCIRSTTTPPSCGMTLPSSEVPVPYATTGVRWLRADADDLRDLFGAVRERRRHRAGAGGATTRPCCGDRALPCWWTAARRTRRAVRRSRFGRLPEPDSFSTPSFAVVSDGPAASGKGPIVSDRAALRERGTAFYRIKSRPVTARMELCFDRGRFRRQSQVMAGKLVFRQLFDATSSTYTYLLGDARTRQAVLIDSVFEQHLRDRALIEELALELVCTLDTHFHADHVTGSWLMQQATGCRIGIVPALRRHCPVRRPAPRSRRQSGFRRAFARGACNARAHRRLPHLRARRPLDGVHRRLPLDSRRRPLRFSARQRRDAVSLDHRADLHTARRLSGLSGA